MKKRKRSTKLNRLVDEAPSSIKRVARTTRSVNRAQPESSLSQPSPATTVKLKFPPKRPLPRPHKAFLQEKNAPEATNTCQEDDDKGVKKGSNSELSSVNPNKKKGEHRDLRTESTPTTENMGAPSSPKHASEGEKKDKEGTPAATTPADLDGEKDGASSFSSTAAVAHSPPSINPPSQPLKFAPKQTSRLCRKKVSTIKEGRIAEQEQ